MITTIVMFFVLILAFFAMFGFVKFAEHVIARPQQASVDDDAAKAAALGARAI